MWCVLCDCFEIAQDVCVCCLLLLRTDKFLDEYLIIKLLFPYKSKRLNESGQGEMNQDRVSLAQRVAERAVEIWPREQWK